MPKLVERWKCDFCRTHRGYKKQILFHEKHCLNNPDRKPRDGELSLLKNCAEIISYYDGDGNGGGYCYEYDYIKLRPKWLPPVIKSDAPEDEYYIFGSGFIWLEGEGWHCVPGYKYDNGWDIWPKVYCHSSKCFEHLSNIPLEFRSFDFKVWREAGYPKMESE